MSRVPAKDSIINVEYDYIRPGRKKIIKSFLGVVLDTKGTTYFEDNDKIQVGESDTWEYATNVTNERETKLRNKADESLGPLPDETLAATYLHALQHHQNAMGKTRRKRKPTKRKPTKRKPSKRKPRKSKPKKRTKRRRNKQAGGS